MVAVAILGLGAMGSRIARRVIAAGHQVVVYNRTRERAAALEAAGAVPVDTPRAAAERSSLIISMVTDDVASRDVWLNPRTGAIGGLALDSIAVESSTLSPPWVAELMTAASDRRVSFFDAPVIGSRPHAETGQLVALLGGPQTGSEVVRSVFSAFTTSLHHLGAAGAGTVVKLAVNAFFGIQVAALAEIGAFVQRMGLNPQETTKLIAGLPITSPALQRIADLMNTKNFVPNFPIELVAKDFRYVAAAAKATGTPPSLLRAAAAIYAAACAAGYGGADIAGIAQLFESRLADGR